MDKESKKNMREVISMFLSVPPIVWVMMCGVWFEFTHVTQREYTALTTTIVIAIVAVLATAIMYFGALHEYLWRAAMSLFVTAILSILVIVIGNSSAVAAIFMIGGWIVLSVMVAGMIFLVGVMLAVVTMA